jgi:hypothetical protein
MTRSHRSTVRVLPGVVLLALGLAWARPLRAQPVAIDADDGTLPAVATIPPAVGNPFIQYGVAFTTEVVASPGQMCSVAGFPCVLGSGGGVVFPRIGWRSSGAWYLGGAYELSKQDANTIYPLAILQQLRGEARYYFLGGHVLNPFVGGSAGLAGYGNEWAVNTFGPEGSVTFGVEAQLSRGTVIGVALNYRAIYFKPFFDSAVERPGSLAQLLGLDLQLEVRDPY